VARPDPDLSLYARLLAPNAEAFAAGRCEVA
jgi:hypothetical protein